MNAPLTRFLTPSEINTSLASPLMAIQTRTEKLPFPLKKEFLCASLYLASGRGSAPDQNSIVSRVTRRISISRVVSRVNENYCKP